MAAIHDHSPKSLNSSSPVHQNPSSEKTNPCPQGFLSRVHGFFFSPTPSSSSDTSHHSQPLKPRITKAKDVHHIERVQEKALKKPHFDSLTLQKLAKQLDKFSKTSDSNRAVIKDTLAILPKEVHSRLYFHLYLLHASKGKKTDYQYGEKAFKSADRHTATHKERATALHNLLLEQLASRFSSLGHQNSEGLMKCFAALPKKDREAIYFHAFQLNTTSRQHGKKVFHRKDHAVETNLLRGQAIYRHLLKRLNVESKHLPADLQKEMHQLRNECGLLKKTVKSEKAATQQAQAVSQELEQRLEQITGQHAEEVETLSSQLQQQQEAHETVKTELAEKTEALATQKQDAEQAHKELNEQLQALTSRHAAKIRTLTAKYKTALKTHDEKATKIHQELEENLKLLDLGHKAQANEIRSLLEEVQNKNKQVGPLAEEVHSLTSQVDEQAQHLRTAKKEIELLKLANQQKIEKLTAAHRDSEKHLIAGIKAQQQGPQLYRAHRLKEKQKETKQEEPASKAARVDKPGQKNAEAYQREIETLSSRAEASQRELETLSSRVDELSQALTAEKVLSKSAKKETLVSKQHIQKLESALNTREEALQRKLSYAEGALKTQLDIVKKLQTAAKKANEVYQEQMQKSQQDASTQIAKLKQTIRQLRKDGQAVQEQNQKLSSELDNLRFDCISEKGKNKKLSSELDDLRFDSISEKGKNKKEFDEVYEKLDYQNRDLELAQKLLRTKGSRIQSLLESTNSLQKQVAKSKSEKAEHTDSLRAAREEVTSLKSKLEQLTDVRNEAEKALEQTRSTLVQKEHQIEQFSAKIASLEETIKKSKNEKSEREFGQQYSQLTRLHATEQAVNLRTTRDEVAALKKQVAALRKTKKALVVELKNCAGELSQLRKSIYPASSDFDFAGARSTADRDYSYKLKNPVLKDLLDDSKNKEKTKK